MVLPGAAHPAPCATIAWAWARPRRFYPLAWPGRSVASRGRLSGGGVLAQVLHALGMVPVVGMHGVEDAGLARGDPPPVPQRVEDRSVARPVGAAERKLCGPAAEHGLAIHFVDHQAIRIHPTPEPGCVDALSGADRLEGVDADGAPARLVDEPAQTERPIVAGYHGKQALDVMIGEPVVVVELGDVAAVRHIAQDGAHRAAESVQMHAAVPHRGGIAGVEQRYRMALGALRQDLVEDSRVAYRPIDADQDLQPARKGLPEYRLHRSLEGRSQHGR